MKLLNQVTRRKTKKIDLDLSQLAQISEGEKLRVKNRRDMSEEEIEEKLAPIVPVEEESERELPQQERKKSVDEEDERTRQYLSERRKRLSEGTQRSIEPASKAENNRSSGTPEKKAAARQTSQEAILTANQNENGAMIDGLKIDDILRQKMNEKTGGNYEHRKLQEQIEAEEEEARKLARERERLRREKEEEDVVINLLGVGSAEEDEPDDLGDLKEQILNAVADTEQVKMEFNVLTDWLKDMQMIEHLPGEEYQKLSKDAGIILKLREDRNTYLKDSAKVEARLYLKLENEMDEIPAKIRKLGDEELYASKLKREIDKYEEKKTSIQFEQSEIAQSSARNIKISIAAICGCIVLLIALTALQISGQADTQIGILLTGICATVVAITVFIRYFNNNGIAQNNRKELKKLIEKQNKIKARYVNQVKGIEYTYNQYEVHSASELMFQWEQFILARNARENSKKAESEITFYEDRLVKQLQSYQIKDAELWLGQLETFADEKEWRFTRKELKKKRKILKLKLEQMYKDMQEENAEISIVGGVMTDEKS